jgi:hypothetical protein
MDRPPVEPTVEPLDKTNPIQGGGQAVAVAGSPVRQPMTDLCRSYWMALSIFRGTRRRQLSTEWPEQQKVG